MEFFVKQPGETFVVAIDFSAVLVDPETISTAVVSAINKGTKVDTTALVIDSSSIDEDNVTDHLVEEPFDPKHSHRSIRTIDHYHKYHHKASHRILRVI